MVQSKLAAQVKAMKVLEVRFFKQLSGNEPVRDWLKGLTPGSDKNQIGTDILAVQYGWPLGLPLVKHLHGDIWEVRTDLPNRIARVLFALDGNVMVLLHGFIKKTQETPPAELKIAKDRWKKK